MAPLPSSASRPSATGSTLGKLGSRGSREVSAVPSGVGQCAPRLVAPDLVSTQGPAVTMVPLPPKLHLRCYLFERLFGSPDRTIDDQRDNSAMRTHMPHLDEHEAAR